MKTVANNPLETVAVVGGGRMGRGISIWMLLHGRQVTLAESHADVLEKSVELLRQRLHSFTHSGRLLQAGDEQAVLSNLRPQVGIVDDRRLAEYDLLIETVTEDIAIKHSLFDSLAGRLGEHTIIGSNASSLEISHLAERVDTPGRFLGTHFFYPVTVNPIIELVRGQKTDPGLLRKMEAFFVEHGKVPIRVKDSAGFALNRFFMVYINTAFWLMEKKGLSAASVDEVGLKIFGSRQGPIEVSTWLGVANVCRDMENMARKFGSFYQPTARLKMYAESQDHLPIGAVEEMTGAQIDEIRADLLGSVFFAILQILDDQVASAVDIDEGARRAMRFNVQPCALMDEMGRDKVEALIAPILSEHGEGMPESIDAVGRLHGDEEG